ncbi:hypothetical protein FOZ63_033820 [Perkinsus olseni]|uniref:DM2 domain-containing protein n=1 Tax=Perkinsus olseni TaxID=32597 RepID=A0A7J6PQP3_PEROL|nr:hypothetical protein FOZ63_033820 [Perkinsus olseni]KAF4742238.1 hypothetical protein FOZ62_013362 [Perkinsus olseni]
MSLWGERGVKYKIQESACDRQAKATEKTPEWWTRLPNQSGESFEDFKLRAKENLAQLARVIEIVPIILTDRDAVDVLASVVPPLHDFLEAFFPSVEASVRRAQTMKSPAGDLQLILKKLVGSKPRARQPPLHRLGLACRLPLIQRQNDASSAQPPCTCTCCSLGPSVVQPGSNAESWLSMICLEKLAFPLATRDFCAVDVRYNQRVWVCHSLGMGHCHFYKCLMNVAYTGESFEHVRRPATAHQDSPHFGVSIQVNGSFSTISRVFNQLDSGAPRFDVGIFESMSGQQTIYTLTSRRLRDLIGSSECTLSQLYTSIWGYARLHGLKRPRGTLQTDDQLAAVLGRKGVIHYSDLPQLLSPLISLGRASPPGSMGAPSPAALDGFVADVRRPKLYRPSDELKFVLQSQRQREICTFEEAVNGVKNYAIDKGLILDVHPMFIVTDSVLRPLFPAASVPLGMLGNFLWYALSPSAIVTTDFPKEYFAPPTTVTPNPALAAIIGEGSKTSQEILLDVAAYVIREGLQKEGRVVVDERLAALNSSWRPGSVIDKLTLFKRVVCSTVNEAASVELPVRHPLRSPTALSKIFDAV